MKSRNRLDKNKKRIGNGAFFLLYNNACHPELVSGSEALFFPISFFSLPLPKL
jgi:hypothetical protein